MPTDVAQVLDLFIKEVHFLKETTVRDHPDAPDLLSHVQFYRDGQQVAVIIQPADRDNMLWGINAGIRTFGADAITFCFESYNATTKTNPATGEDWEGGDMQAIFKYPELNQGAVVECVSVHGYTKDREIVASATYKIEDGAVVWLDREKERYDSDYDEATSVGVIPEAIKQAFSKISLFDVMARGVRPPEIMDDEEYFRLTSTLSKLRLGFTEEQIEFRVDMAGVKNIIEDPDRPPQMGVGLAATPGSDRAKYIAENMARMAEQEELDFIHM